MTELTEITIEAHFLRRPTFWIIAAVVALFAATGLASLGSLAGTVVLVVAICGAGLFALSALRAR